MISNRLHLPTKRISQSVIRTTGIVVETIFILFVTALIFWFGLQFGTPKEASDTSESLNSALPLASSGMPTSIPVNILSAEQSASDADFEKRCHAVGVVKCVGFDSPDEITPFLSKDSDGVIRGSLDSDVKASGHGSLRFEIPSRSGQNSSGSWTSGMGASFGEGQTFYVQYRQRFAPEFLKTKYEGGAGWKQSIFHMGGKTCASIEITTVNGFYRGFPIVYTDCGSRDFSVALRNSDFLLEQGDSPSSGYNCHYQNRSNCAFYKPNQWMTFYYEVKIGDWGQPNSSVKAWVGYEGQPLKQFVNGVNYKLNFNTGPSDVFDSVSLLPYNTGKSQGPEYPTTYTWYDELIVSRNPILSPSISTKN